MMLGTTAIASGAIIALVAIAACGALCVAYGVFVERRWFRRAQYRLEILPATSSPLSIVHLSDLHFVARDGKKRAFLSSMPRPDVTVVTGDLLGEPEGVEGVVEALHPLLG